MADFNFIVIGAGSAGCALAARLSESGKVLLLEAGGPARGQRFKMPVAFMSLWFDPEVTWSYLTEPEPGLEGRRLPVPRGRVMGGSSAINGMVCTRGSPWDYDQWAALGLDGWSYRHVLPYFRKLESNWRGATREHGDHGPLPVARYPWVSRHARLVFEAAEAMGFPPTDDFAGPRPEGYGLPDFNTRRGRRVSAADAYLGPHRRNLTVETGARATRVLIEGGRAVGVEYLKDGQVLEAWCDGEIALCGGVFNSPQLLMLSGVGPADALRSLGIDPVVDLPGVGQRLEDQPAARFSMAATDDAISFNRQLRFDRFALSTLRWYVSGTGPLSAPPILSSFIVRTAPGLPAPDMRLMIGAAPLDSRLWFPGVRKAAPSAVSAAFSLCYPKSRGAVTLGSADPLAPPNIQLNLLADPDDVAEMRRGYRLMREMLAKPSLAPFSGAMIQPPVEPKTDAEVDAYLRANAATTFHPIGTCRMGVGDDAVLDAALKVRSVAGLRVVDTSVFPTQIGGNPNVPAMMIAEKAADLMLGRPQLAPAEA